MRTNNLWSRCSSPGKDSKDTAIAYENLARSTPPNSLDIETDLSVASTLRRSSHDIDGVSNETWRRQETRSRHTTC